MFAYYDAAFPTVQFLGTAVWDSGKFNNEAVMAKSLYTAISKPQTNSFANQYYSIFNDRPSSLYTLAYDAVNIANQLAHSNEKNLNENITKQTGFQGIGGRIRFFKNGNNQHSLDIVEILPSGNIIIDNGAAYFETITDNFPFIEIDSQYHLPKIFGKDSTLAQILIYGQTLPIESQEIAPNNFENDNTIADTQLKEMGIYIN